MKAFKASHFKNVTQKKHTQKNKNVTQPTKVDENTIQSFF